MNPVEWMFVGACVGWAACAVAFWLLPSWRAQDVVSMDDQYLVALMQECGAEWCYRHPEIRPEYEKALAAGREIASQSTEK